MMTRGPSPEHNRSRQDSKDAGQGNEVNRRTGALLFQSFDELIAINL